IFCQVNRDLSEINYVYLNGGIQGTYVYGGTGNGINASSHPDVYLAQFGVLPGGVSPVITVGGISGNVPSGVTERTFNVYSAGTTAQEMIVTNAGTYLGLDAIDNAGTPYAHVYGHNLSGSIPLVLNRDGGTVYTNAVPNSAFNALGLVLGASFALTTIAYAPPAPLSG